MSDSEKEKISKYFSVLKEIINKYQAKPDDNTVKLLYGLNASHFLKITQLLKEFDKFETESYKSFEKLNTFLETLNFFLRDSAKKLVFNEETAELAYDALDKNGKIISKFRDLQSLSSGEQQILILFTYIAFNSQDGRIFIIDEPELSLHIKWQEDFLSQLERITPKATQLIFATHSPILANKKKEKAKILFPYNI